MFGQCFGPSSSRLHGFEAPADGYDRAEAGFCFTNCGPVNPANRAG